MMSYRDNRFHRPRRRLPQVRVIVRREPPGDGWLVICRKHSWAHGSLEAAMVDARFVARCYGEKFILIDAEAA